MVRAPLPDFVFEWARRTPDAEVVSAGAIRLSYRALADRIVAHRDALLASGLRPGARVAHLGHPGPEFLVSALATQAAGGVWMGLNPKHTAPELAYVLADAEPAFVILDAAVGAGAMDACRAAVDGLDAPPTLAIIDGLDDLSRPLPRAATSGAAAPEGVGLIVYTSGTTGKPKGACLTHAGIDQASALYAQRYAHEGMCGLLNLPINHVGSIIDIVSPALRVGGRLVTMPTFLPHAIPDVMRHERVTILGQVPAMHLAIDAFAAYDVDALPTLKHLVWSGAAMPRSWIAPRIGGRVELSTCYGLTEATGSVTFTRPDATLDELADTVGAPAAEGMVRIVREDGMIAGSDEPGEVQMRGAFVMQGYFKRPEATASALTADGWLKTGDLGLVDARGAVRLVGRKSEMYKSGGYNVYPREVEIALESFPGVSAAAVVSAPDPQWQEVGWAFVLSAGNVAEGDITAFLRQRLANYKIPKRIVIRADLPLLPIGKIDKQALRKAIVDGHYGA